MFERYMGRLTVPSFRPLPPLSNSPFWVAFKRRRRRRRNEPFSDPFPHLDSVHFGWRLNAGDAVAENVCDGHFGSP